MAPTTRKVENTIGIHVCKMKSSKSAYHDINMVQYNIKMREYSIQSYLTCITQPRAMFGLLQ
jgi:hypothetical protein